MCRSRSKYSRLASHTDFSAGQFSEVHRSSHPVQNQFRTKVLDPAFPIVTICHSELRESLLGGVDSISTQKNRTTDELESGMPCLRKVALKWPTIDPTGVNHEETEDDLNPGRNLLPNLHV